MAIANTQPLRLAKVGGPPAIWAAFSRQSAWKSWVIAAQLVVIVLLVFVALALAKKREPDVVVVQPDGKSQGTPSGFGATPRRGRLWRPEE